MSGRPRDGGSRSPRWTAWLVAARDGDPAAFDALCGEARPGLWRRARQRLNDDSLADDAVSQALARVWEHRADYDPAQSNAATWLYRILDQRVIDALKKGRGPWAEVLGFEGLAPGAGEDGDGAVHLEPADDVELPPGEEADRRRADVLLREGMAQLSESDRRVLELFHFRQLDYKAIAREMGLSSEKAVGPRLTRARQRLLARLPPEALE